MGFEVMLNHVLKFFNSKFKISYLISINDERKNCLD